MNYCHGQNRLDKYIHIYCELKSKSRMLRNKETKNNFPHHPPSFQAQFPSFIPDFSTSSLPLLA